MAPRTSQQSHTFILNGKRVHVECEGDVRLLWVLRDLLGVNGPKYGCGLMVCKACTCLVNGHARQICGIPVGELKDTDRVVTIEGLADSVGKPLHPMQQAWIDHDVAQCGYCQPGQIMDAVGLVNDIHAKGRQVTAADLDRFRNVCRCGTYPRIRDAILQAAKADVGGDRNPKASPPDEGGAVKGAPVGGVDAGRGGLAGKPGRGRFSGR
jgi:isoquinoline 1-oxidoreductase alpha subunit